MEGGKEQEVEVGEEEEEEDLPFSVSAMILLKPSQSARTVYPT